MVEVDKELQVLQTMGDNAAFTGLPAAYHRLTGLKLAVSCPSSAYAYLWERNPYVEYQGKRTYKCLLTPPESMGRLVYSQVYKPVYFFGELTGKPATAVEVRPNLYLPRKPVPRRLIVCDEAGWPNRKGYPYLKEVVAGMMADGWDVIHLIGRTKKWDYGTQAAWENELVDLKLDTAQMSNCKAIVDFMATGSAFIGYESGLGHVAGALDVPYAFFAGGTSVTANRHPSCVFAIDGCFSVCLLHACPHHCIAKLVNHTDQVVEAFKEFK
jgi:hypothetical protein